MMDEERLDSEDQFEMTVQDTNLEAQKAKRYYSR